MKIIINKNKIYEECGIDIEKDIDYINYIKELAGFLERNNKNYNNKQYYAILDIKSILDNIELESKSEK